MAVTVIRSDGRRQQINGRHGAIIEAIVDNHEEWLKHERMEIQIHCIGNRVTISPQPILNLPPAND